LKSLDIKNRSIRILKKFFVSILLAIMVIFVLFPILWIVSTSIKPETDVMKIPPVWIPNKPTLYNYYRVFTDSTIPKNFLNSMIVSFITATIAIIFGSLTGYGLARHKTKTTTSISIFILGSQMLPEILILIPMYMLISYMKLYDTLLGLALVHLFITLPLVTWLCKGYFQSIPIDLEEAALIDGCNRFQVLTKIILPISAPGIAASGLYAFIQSWNEFTLASVLTESTRSRTLPIGLTSFALQFRVDWGATMAASVIISLPVIILFYYAQRYLVSGLAQGAVKG